jgi:predicted CoA-binding protein
MKSTVTVKIIKKDINTRKLKRIASEINKYYAQAGINREEGRRVISKGGFTQVQNAYLQEFGGEQRVERTRRFMNNWGKWFYIKAGTIIRIPARIFIRIFTVSHRFREYLQFELQEEVNKYFKQKMDAKTFWNKVGIYARDTMKSRIEKGVVTPQNSAMTEEFKGRNKPLYQSGQMTDDIKHKVMRK